MNLIKQKKHPLIILLTVLILFVGANAQETHGFTDQVLQRGATGDDVVELQARLQWIGFFDGKIDGVFGWSTYWAVRHYQDEFGMEVDGIVDQKMKESLGRTTEFKKDFVYKALREGRKFTHYGGVAPFEIQKGPKGSEDGQVTQTQQQRKQQQQQEQEQRKQQQQQQQQQPLPGAPETAQETVPEEASPAPGEAQAQGTVEGASPAPEEAPVTPGTPGEAPAPGATPGEEPVPAEEAPVTPAEDEPNIQQAINVPNGFSDNDIQLMAQCVFAESRGEPYVGMVAVAAVILNRVNSPDFPNTISEVIYEPRAFEPVANGTIYNQPSEEARRAVMDALNGQDPTGHALYFFNPATARSPWVWSRPQIKTIGKHVFAK